MDELEPPKALARSLAAMSAGTPASTHDNADADVDHAGSGRELGSHSNPHRLPLGLRGSLLRRIGPVVLIILLALSAGWMARQIQEPGHDWGDDFALYIRQAKALSDGGTEQVLADTRFSVGESGWNFSAEIYPWGFPILIAPVIAVKGIDYEALKYFEIGSLVVALIAFTFIVRRRLGLVAALVGLVFFCFSQMLLGAAGAVLSDLPYLAWVMVTLWCIDWCRSSGAFRGTNTRPLVLTGLAAAMTFSTRREGLLVLLAALAAQGLDIAADVRFRRTKSEPGLGSLLRRIRAVPWRAHHHLLSSFLALVAAIHVLLPGGLGATYDVTAADPRTNWSAFRKILAEYIGVKDIGDYPISLNGNTGRGTLLLGMFVSAVIVGVAVCVFSSLRRDGHLIVYFVLHVVLLTRLSFREPRYLLAPLFLAVFFALALVPGAVSLLRQRPRRLPLLAAMVAGVLAAIGIRGIAPTTPLTNSMYFAAVLLPMALRWIPAIRKRVMSPRRGRRWATSLAPALAIVPAAAFFAPMTMANGGRLLHAIDYHRVYNYTIEGPTSPAAVEMFAKVRSMTRADDVIAYFRARSMMLYTDRRTIQNSNLQLVAAKADWYVMTRNPDGTPGTYGQYPLTDADANRLGFVKAFENTTFTIFRTPSRPPVPIIEPKPVS